MKTIISQLFGVIIIAVALWWLIILHLDNPDFTDTRLFLSFWKEYLIIGALIIVGYLTLIQWERKV